MKLLDLNYDCLRRMCLFFDAESIVFFSETCRTAKNITENLFKRVNSYTCCIDSKESEKRAALTVKKIGNYLEKIGLMIELNYRCSDQFFMVLTESLGNRLIELSILGETCSMPLTTLAPIFSQLQILRIHNMCWSNECVSRVDLPLLCPKLLELTVVGKVSYTEKLQQFKLLEKLDVDYDSEEPHYFVFFENQQLKKLHLWNRRNIEYYIPMDELTLSLVNLEELHLDVRLLQTPITQIRRLNEFANLHTVLLYTIPVAQFNDILTSLQTLTRLRNITLQSDLTRLDHEFSPAQESLIRIATALTELQAFTTINIDWTSEAVREFVGEARNLLYYDFWSGLSSNYIITPTFIRELAATRKLTVGEAMEPLNLKMYAMGNDLRQVFNETEVAKYIRLSK